MKNVAVWIYIAHSNTRASDVFFFVPPSLPPQLSLALNEYNRKLKWAKSLAINSFIKIVFSLRGELLQHLLRVIFEHTKGTPRPIDESSEHEKLHRRTTSVACKAVRNSGEVSMQKISIIFRAWKHWAVVWGTLRWAEMRVSSAATMWKIKEFNFACQHLRRITF